jgi:hypothetical protein
MTPEKDSLSALFAREVSAALQDFPQLRGRSLFVYAPPQDFSDAEVRIEATPRALAALPQREFRKLMAAFEKKADPMSARAAGGYLHILLYTKPSHRRFTAEGQPEDMEATAAFDHELAHLVARGGFDLSDKTACESVADCYAVLRHRQRYGAASQAGENIASARAFQFILSGDVDHFTTFAVEEALRRRDRPDISAMTPRQLAEEAYGIAAAATPSPAERARLSAAFAPVRAALAGEGIDAALRRLAEITLSADPGSGISGLGRHALLPLLGSSLTNAAGDTYALTGPYWERIGQTLSGPDKRAGTSPNP